MLYLIETLFDDDRTAWISYKSKTMTKKISNNIVNNSDCRGADNCCNL